MQVLAFQFKALAICGIWRPVDWTSRSQIILYKLYSFVCIFTTVSLTVLQGYLLLVSEFDFKTASEVLFSLLTSITVCVKTCSFVLRREKMIRLANMLRVRWCLPTNDEEVAIQKRSNDFVKLYTIVLNTMAQCTVALWLILAVFHDHALPIRTWLPYTVRLYEQSFWWTYVYQAIAMILSVMVNSTVDTTISGMMLQTCTQLEILAHRLNEMPERLRKADKSELRRVERESLVQTVLHHNHIINYAHRVNEAVDFVVVEQFFASSLILSIIVYQLSKNNTVGALQTAMDLLYLGCMLLEFFGYCWFGNEITLKCMEFGVDIYKIDWTKLSMRANKTLLFIVLRTRKPVVLSVGHFIVLNVESFKSILKVSYTAYNVLKEST